MKVNFYQIFLVLLFR